MRISCPKCNGKVSDKAHVCPHCGFQIDTLIKCPDCGRLVPPETSACPECGCPLAQEGAGFPIVKGASDPASTPQAGRTGASSQSGVKRDSARPARSQEPVPSSAVEASEKPRRRSTGDDYPCWRYREAGILSQEVLSTNEVRRRIAGGRMARNMEVWTNGADKWRPASKYVVFSRMDQTSPERQKADERVSAARSNPAERQTAPSPNGRTIAGDSRSAHPEPVQKTKGDAVLLPAPGTEVVSSTACKLPSATFASDSVEQVGVPITSSSHTGVVGVDVRSESDAAVMEGQTPQDERLSIFTLLWAFEIGGVLACGNPGTLLILLRAMPLRSWRGMLLRFGLWIALPLAEGALMALAQAVSLAVTR